jgi:hypothetical protein
MENWVKKFEDNYLLGCIKYNDKHELYLMPIAWWILNYKKYDPDPKLQSIPYESGLEPSKPERVFRDNILNVTDDEIEAYLNSIKEDKLTMKDLQTIINVPMEFRYIFFYIDFDCKVFTNGFFDIEVENYLPDQTWKGEAVEPGEPVNYLPQVLKKIIEPWQSENME